MSSDATPTYGRPTKCTPDVIDEFVELLEEGLYIVTCCDLVGVDNKTYYNWMDRGEAEIARVQEAHDADPDSDVRVAEREAPFVSFFQRCTRAIAQAERDALRSIRESHQGDRDGDWHAAAWFLARKSNDRWGKKQKVEHSGEIQGGVTIIELPDNGRGKGG